MCTSLVLQIPEAIRNQNKQDATTLTLPYEHTYWGSSSSNFPVEFLEKVQVAVPVLPATAVKPHTRCCGTTAVAVVRLSVLRGPSTS